jgi:hypothetical protein
LERLSQFHNPVALITDMNALRLRNFCPDRLLANHAAERDLQSSSARSLIDGHTKYPAIRAQEGRARGPSSRLATHEDEEFRLGDIVSGSCLEEIGLCFGKIGRRFGDL